MRTTSILVGVATAMATAVSAQSGSRQTEPYSDPTTGFVLQSYADGTGYRFGLALPQQDSKDLIVQIVTPLNQAGAGWAGIDFGNRMIGPLLVVTWPKGDAAKSVMISPRKAGGKNAAAVVKYTDQPISIRPIARGTFVNATHLSATFVCGGCINSDSFDPKTSSTGEFAYAYSLTSVVTPESDDTMLSDHSRGGHYGPFGVDLAGARSTNYGTYAAMAGAPASSSPSNPTSTAPTGGGGSTPGTSGAMNLEYSRMGPGAAVALAFVGVFYMLGAFSAL